MKIKIQHTFNAWANNLSASPGSEKYLWNLNKWTFSIEQEKNLYIFRKKIQKFFILVTKDSVRRKTYKNENIHFWQQFCVIIQRMVVDIELFTEFLVFFLEIFKINNTNHKVQDYHEQHPITIPLLLYAHLNPIHYRQKKYNSF